MAAKKKQNQDRVVEMLNEAIAVREQRNADYADAYILHGNVVKALFPDGVKLDTPEDMRRFAVLDIIIGKLLRYTLNFDKGGHDDSMKDISVYSNMLRHLDELGEQ